MLRSLKNNKTFLFIILNFSRFFFLLRNRNKSQSVLIFYEKKHHMRRGRKSDKEQTLGCNVQEEGRYDIDVLLFGYTIQNEGRVE